MRVALVASSYLPEPGRLERRVHYLAHGLAQHGVEVEILTQGPGPWRTEQSDGVVIRRFPSVAGPLHFTVSPRLRERLRVASQTFDIIDVHTRQASLALAVAGTRARHLVLTPCASIDAFLGRLHTRATRTVLGGSAHIVCRSEIERDLLCRAVPHATARARVVPDGVDVHRLRSAEPFPVDRTVVLAVDRLDRGTGVGRAIAAMASLGPEFMLVVVGDGPARDRLAAFAADLRVSSRVQFAGAVPDDVLYRWLRSARVVVALACERSSGSLVAEACASDLPVVASDLPAHRGAAKQVGGGSVIFLTPRGSPLDVADAIGEAADLPVITNPELRSFSAPSWDSAIDATWELYRETLAKAPQPAWSRGVTEVVDLAAELHAGGKGPAPTVVPTLGRRFVGPVGEVSRWRTQRAEHRINGGRKWL